MEKVLYAVTLPTLAEKISRGLFLHMKGRRRRWVRKLYFFAVGPRVDVVLAFYY